MLSETEYQISLCKACSGSKSNQKLSCNKSTTYCSEIFFNFEKFMNDFKTSYEKYTQKYGDIEKEIEFYVVFSSNPLRSKWNIPAISKTQLKKYIREQIFRKIADNKIDLICTINNHDIKLKVCDCDEFMQFIN